MNDGPSSASLPFSTKTHNPDRGVRLIVTGQVGLDKKPILQQVVDIAKKNGNEIKLFHVGELMCAEAPDIVPHRILDLPRQRLTALRRSVFKDILAEATPGANIIVNTHATFRWKHGLFHAFDHNQLMELNPNLFVTLVDNVDAVHERLERDHEISHTLKDILVWREEEIVVTEALAEAVAGYGKSYVISRSHSAITAKSLYRLMFEPQRKRVYPSFPMTHILDQPTILREVEQFRDTLAEHFITFDPADLDEKRLIQDAMDAENQGKNMLTLMVNGREITLDVSEVSRIARDIDAQIYARDFKLIEQSDMIVSYIPALPNGKPVLSSGVERELQHAHESTKEVYVIWKPDYDPSPFITETATRVFPSIEQLYQHFQKQGYIGDYQLHLS